MSPDTKRRFNSLGLRALSEVELVQSLGVPADTAHRLMHSHTLRDLGKMAPEDLAGHHGIGESTALRILAATEIGRRAASLGSTDDRDRVRGPSDIWARMGQTMSNLQVEEFHAVLLNAQHRVIKDVLITRGILDASLVHPREVFRPAVASGAAALVLVHNHPSGDPTPSVEDRAVTRQLAAAGRSIGIPVLDHVVIGSDSYKAFSDEPGGVG